METIKDYFLKDEFARRMGIELVDVAPGRARARLTVRPEHHNAVGLAQGGAIFTLADFAFAAASNSHGQMALGIQASISFLKGVPEGTLTAEAREISRSHKLAVYAVEVTDGQGQPVAAFQGTVYRKKDRLPFADSDAS